jgi:hypothetical protein
MGAKQYTQVELLGEQSLIKICKEQIRQGCFAADLFTIVEVWAKANFKDVHTAIEALTGEIDKQYIDALKVAVEQRKEAAMRQEINHIVPTADYQLQLYPMIAECARNKSSIIEALKLLAKSNGSNYERQMEYAYRAANEIKERLNNVMQMHLNNMGKRGDEYYIKEDSKNVLESRARSASMVWIEAEDMLLPIHYLDIESIIGEIVSHREQTIIDILPEELKFAVEYFKKAIDAGMIEVAPTGLIWIYPRGRGRNARIAYFGDKIRSACYIEYPNRALESMFNVNGLSRSLGQLRNYSKKIQPWMIEIDNLFK